MQRRAFVRDCQKAVWSMSRDLAPTDGGTPGRCGTERVGRDDIVAREQDAIERPVHPATVRTAEKRQCKSQYYIKTSPTTIL